MSVQRLVDSLARDSTSRLVAGLAQNQEMLIGARALQGVGAALLTPASLALLPELFPEPRERGVAIGVWGGVGALALAVGPLTGGWLSQHVSWGWIFLINAPIGVATAILAAATIPAGRRGATRGMDLPGLFASSLALFALTYALIEGVYVVPVASPIQAPQDVDRHGSRVGVKR